MKKIIFALAAATLMLTMFAGCGNNNDNMASDINSTVSRVESDVNSMMPGDNVSSESH